MSCWALTAASELLRYCSRQTELDQCCGCGRTVSKLFRHRLFVLRVFTDGTTAWLSHWLAERDRQAYRQQLVFALTFALGASLAIGCAYFVGRAFIGVPPSLVDGFWSYTEVRIIGAPMAMLNLVIVGYFIATERAKTALLHAFIVHGSNISLNILAVELLQLGRRVSLWQQFSDIRCVDGRTFDRSRARIQGCA